MTDGRPTGPNGWRAVKAYLKSSAYARPLIELVWTTRTTKRTLVRNVRQALIARHYSTVSRRQFLDEVRAAIEGSRGYAVGKIGKSNQVAMYYPLFLQQEHDAETRRAYERDLAFSSLQQTGIFPNDPEFCLSFNEFYMEQVRNIDSLGICYNHPHELEIIKHYRLSNNLIFYPEQEPDRSRPNNDANCYLPSLRDRKLLIVCPFAKFLAGRANEALFERVWSKTGKRWFHPRNVDALEFPYGFSRDTHAKYPTAFELLEDIKTEILKRDFDVALIGAAGLAIPIASFVKRLGKVGLDLGGALQFFFGVQAKRWQDWEHFKRDYFNEYWEYVPAEYTPKETDVCDQLAYWRAS
jgi:hypothetical protein